MWFRRASSFDTVMPLKCIKCIYQFSLTFYLMICIGSFPLRHTIADFPKSFSRIIQIYFNVLARIDRWIFMCDCVVSLCIDFDGSICFAIFLFFLILVVNLIFIFYFLNLRVYLFVFIFYVAFVWPQPRNWQTKKMHKHSKYKAHSVRNYFRTFIVF